MHILPCTSPQIVRIKLFVFSWFFLLINRKLRQQPKGCVLKCCQVHWNKATVINRQCTRNLDWACSIDYPMLASNTEQIKMFCKQYNKVHWQQRCKQSTILRFSEICVPVDGSATLSSTKSLWRRKCNHLARAESIRQEWRSRNRPNMTIGSLRSLVIRNCFPQLEHQWLFHNFPD